MISKVRWAALREEGEKNTDPYILIEGGTVKREGRSTGKEKTSIAG